jgi:membrane-bound lytic murein transglycosylase A
VFFKPTPLRGTGKFGQLVAGRSVAVDAAKVPLGAALWMRTELASATASDPAHHQQIARLALAQDTGAAIRGIGRVDIFVGSGAEAQHAAAFTSRPGELYLIVHKSPRPAPDPVRPHRHKHHVPRKIERQQS